MRPDLAARVLGFLMVLAIAPLAAFPSLPLAERQLLAPLALAWPALDADTRARLRANAAHWAALDPAARDALRARVQAWDALPPAEKARRRGPFAAWLELSEAERDQVRSAAARFAALSPEHQQALRAAFEALPSDQRQDWWLGPDVGAGFAELRPLFAFVPEGERATLRALLMAGFVAHAVAICVDISGVGSVTDVARFGFACRRRLRICLLGLSLRLCGNCSDR